jgi:hypothetical protein
MAIFNVQNQWGGIRAPWSTGGVWSLGARHDQNVVDIDINSGDGGKTLTGTITYAGEGPIGFKGTQISGNNYAVENQWGGDNAPWHPGGFWLIGGRDSRRVVSLKVSGDKNLNGGMTYQGEGPISFKGNFENGSSYNVKNQWGGNNAPWHESGTFILSNRENQNPVAFDISSSDGGKTFGGSMTYAGEGPVGFKASNVGLNSYTVGNQWGGSNTAWHTAGVFVIGARLNQNVVSMKIQSKDGGETFEGQMTYVGEGPIGFKGVFTSMAVSKPAWLSI